MNKKYVRPCFVNLLTLFVGCFLIVPSVLAQEKNSSEKSLADLFENFKTAAKLPCGERAEAIRLGEQLIKRYESYRLNKDVVEFVEWKIAKIKNEDRNCDRDFLYTKLFNDRYWQPFIAVSKQIIADEGDNPLALDVMLTLVSVGYDRALVDKKDTYNRDTLNYAWLAILKIEAGQKSETKKWGVFLPFNTRENALSWMNYVVGWMMYHKMNEKKEALAYFYRSAQIGSEKKTDINIFTAIGSYYFDEAVRLDTAYREKRKENYFQDTDETSALLALTRGTAERAIYFFAKAYTIAVETNATKQLIGALYKTLIDLYRFRFNSTDYQPVELDEYIERLINRPMPDPSKPFDPALEEPVDLKLKRNKWQ